MVGKLFSCWGPASFQERDAVSFSEVSPSKISFTRGRESHRVARRNQSMMMMMQNVCGKDSPAPTLRKRLILGAPVCRIPKIDPIWLAHIFSKVLVVERPPTIEKTSWDSENWVVLQTTQQNCPNSLAFFCWSATVPPATSPLARCHLLRPGNLIVWRLLSASWASMIPKCWRRWVFTGDGWSSVANGGLFGVPLAAFCLSFYELGNRGSSGFLEVVF